MQSRYAIMFDGGFVTKKLQKKLNRFPTGSDIEAECKRISANSLLKDRDLLRNYWYDAEPATDEITNPLDRSVTKLATTTIFTQHKTLLDKLELAPHFAVRRGRIAMHGWKLGEMAIRSMMKAPKAPTAKDLIPDFQQKGVDLCIGLDIARLALRGMVDIIVVVTGDSDLVPAFKFARREGLRIFLDHMGHGVRLELKAHADVII